MEMGECAFCGRKFRRIPANKAYCSVECRNLAKAGRKRRKREPRSGLGTRVCHDCGRPTANYRCASCWERVRKGVDA